MHPEMLYYNHRGEVRTSNQNPLPQTGMRSLNRISRGLPVNEEPNREAPQFFKKIEKVLDKSSSQCYTIIRKREQQKNKKEITKMMINFDTYEMIADLLMMGGDEPTYSVEEIAEMVGVDVEIVNYVDRAENDVM